jgi:4-hydroxy-tetrahydrodipicolinate reductase
MATETKPLSVLISGIEGRMGREIVKGARSGIYGPWIVLGGVKESGSTEVTEAGTVSSEYLPQFKQAEVIIDFSSNAGTRSALQFAVQHKIPLVIGTTGLNQEFESLLKRSSMAIPIIQANNTSVGVNTLLGLVEKASQLLSGTYEVEITEVHHHHKKDAPSGTAVSLLNAVEKGRELSKLHKAAPLYGRYGMVGARPSEEIGVHALRGGDIVGEHTVFFFGEGERLEFTHRATDRSIFATGALRAARWLPGEKPGIYTMADVLGL